MNYVLAKYQSGAWQIYAQSAPIAHLPAPAAGELVAEIGTITTVNHDTIRAALSITKVKGVDTITINTAALAPLGHTPCATTEASLFKDLSAKKPTPLAVRKHLKQHWEMREDVPVKVWAGLGYTAAQIKELYFMRKKLGAA